MGSQALRALDRRDLGPGLDVAPAEHPKLAFTLEFDFELGWGGDVLRWTWGKQLEAALNMPYLSSDGFRGGLKLQLSS